MNPRSFNSSREKVDYSKFSPGSSRVLDPCRDIAREGEYGQDDYA